MLSAAADIERPPYTAPSWKPDASGENDVVTERAVSPLSMRSDMPAVVENVIV